MTEELDMVFFDLGGTLVDLNVPRESIWAGVLKEHGAEVDMMALSGALRRADRDLDEAFASIQGTDERPFWRAYDARVIDSLDLGLDPQDVMAGLTTSFGKIIPDETAWKDYPDAKPTLENLRRRDIRIGLISNATDLARRVLRRLDMERFFDPIIISSEVGHRKPDRRIFQRAANEARVPPSRALYIGDKLAVDIRGASNAGMNAVLIDREGIFEDAPCVRIPDLSAIRAFL